MDGYIVVSRDHEDCGVYVEATDDLFRFVGGDERRMIYCQAVSDVETVQEELGRWLETHQINQNDDINDIIAEIVSSVQWIANDHPLRCFRVCLHQ